MSQLNFTFILIVILEFSCQKVNVIEDKNAFDIIVIMGQSNTLNGFELDSTIDKISDGVLQLGRHGSNNYNIIEAKEPLEHWDVRQNKNGFGLPFAKIYKDNLLKKDKKVLLIPCGKGNTGFADGQWNKGNLLYNDAIERIKWILIQYPKSELKAILWQQGERDILLKNPNYQSNLDSFVKNLFYDLSGYNSNFVFIAGGLVPYWVDKNKTLRMSYQETIQNLPKRIERTGFGNPYEPFIITKKENDFDTIHYDAAGQRELAKRYFTAYQKLTY